MFPKIKQVTEAKHLIYSVTLTTLLLRVIRPPYAGTWYTLLVYKI